MTDPKARKKLESIIKNDYRDSLIKNGIGYPSFKSYVLWLESLKERGFEICAPHPLCFMGFLDGKDETLVETIRGFRPLGESDESNWEFRMFPAGEPTKSVFVVSVPEELALKILVLGGMP
jgi:hypothetical protein